MTEDQFIGTVVCLMDGVVRVMVDHDEDKWKKIMGKIEADAVFWFATKDDN
ncbi:hypothetical protein [Jeotgalibacillus soli]|uniref:Uncharacterized protein n=1 Tax=Jeotgalibacillus soli TaxID=889306 RepID=A0A0C2VP43_9BACL|nr:hypothetical protein [Jeotgalibacillus soli]KIL45778.1 hypothetical protein KP78_21270 [Jeotgalibacillus soli]